MHRKTFIRLLILRTIGNFLILFMIFGFFATFGPALFYEISYRVEKAKGFTYKVVDAKEQSEFGKLLEKYKNSAPVAPDVFGTLISKNNQKILIPPDINFSIVIPKIGAAQAVASNVDPANEKEYLEVLKSSIAHAKGTAFPGMDGTTYLFAHSADNFWNVGRYNAVFYLLKEMESEDDIYVYFQGKRHNYKVYDKKIIDSNDSHYVNSNIGQGEILILQTCWPPGTAWKRLLIFAKP